MKRLVISGLTLNLILMSAAAWGASKETQKGQAMSKGQISIRIHDYAQANPVVLEHAEQVASEILQKAGVDARWVDCSDSSGKPACSIPLTTLDFVMNLLPRSMSDRLHFPQGVLGRALEGSGQGFGFIASVFYDLAKDRAMEHQVDFGELLGDAMAHELGHLLLGTNSHSGVSLMSGFWSGTEFRLASQGALSFSGSEVKKIQASIDARKAAAAEFTREEQFLVARNSSE